MANLRTYTAICSILILALIWEPVLHAQDDGLAQQQMMQQQMIQQQQDAAAQMTLDVQQAAQQTFDAAAQQAQADSQPAVPSVPIPAQIRTAKTVFISNAGDKTNLFPDFYSGGPDRPYVAFYAAMQQWGHYQLVSSPDQADLVMEIGISNPQSVQSVGRDVDSVNSPQLHLNILDAKTRVSLWQLTSHIQTSVALKAKRDKQFDTAMALLVKEVQQLSTQTSTTADSSLLGQKSHAKGQGIAIAVVLGVFVIAAIAGAVAFHHNTPPPPTQPTYPPQQYPAMHLSLFHR